MEFSADERAALVHLLRDTIEADVEVFFMANSAGRLLALRPPGMPGCPFLKRACSGRRAHRDRSVLVNYVDELPYFCAEVLPRLARLDLREEPGAV